jgi:hypothetical protein
MRDWGSTSRTQTDTKQQQIEEGRKKNQKKGRVWDQSGYEFSERRQDGVIRDLRSIYPDTI